MWGCPGFSLLTPSVCEPSILQRTFKNLADSMYERINLQNECERSIVFVENMKRFHLSRLYIYKD